MNHSDLKTYAPQARRDFIQAVTERAALYGVTAAQIEPVTEKGDVVVIGGRAFPSSIVPKRKKLIERIGRAGFDQTMEALAYTWFNRFVAIRFMELHGYLEHGYRVLSHPDPAKTIPEILEIAEHVDLPGLSREKVIDLKLDVNKEAELYQMLLLAQCHALHAAMPFLFEGIDDETELVLPENLLHSDSIIRSLVAASDPEDWQEVEVLGWLYQFYISERKDEVMARKSAVPTEDIPAVTQIFTPHWIVRYLVENSLGRLWLLNRPGSKLREHMPYYIEGEAETDFLKITKPEDIRLLDPACGSGHMLTYAFDLLFLIYEEEGYVPNEIPALILRHNLHGLEICPRAAQLANLALVFKARGNSSRFLQPGNLVPPRIRALQNIRFDEGELRDYVEALDLGNLFNQPMLQLLHQFEEATTFGSLIQPCLDEAGVAYARQAIEAKDLGSQMFLRETHAKVLLALEQAEMLCQRYHAVVANPPYMGSRQMNSSLKTFAKELYPDSRSDLFAMFIERGFTLALPYGSIGIITMESWMFLSSYEEFRTRLVRERTILTAVHMPYLGKGGTSMGISFGTAAVVFGTFSSPNFEGHFSCVRYYETDEAGVPTEFPVQNERLSICNSREFSKLPGSPIAYWVSKAFRQAFVDGLPLHEYATPRAGMITGNNALFVRRWHEVSHSLIGLNITSLVEARESGRKWFPYQKGGAFRKWFGNYEFIVDWEDNGSRLKTTTNEDGKAPAHAFNEDYIFKPNVNWSALTSSAFSTRITLSGCLFDAAGSAAFPSGDYLYFLSAFLNSRVCSELLKAINPTLNFQAWEIGGLPILASALSIKTEIDSNTIKLRELACADWDNFETSWDFRDQPLLRPGLKGATLEASWQRWEAQCTAAIRRMQELDTENNRLFITAYGLDGELKPEVPEEKITLARADAHSDIAAFVSYAVGCIMGRYSLDRPGLILADAGDSLAEYLAKVGKPLDRVGFYPDEDGIIPMLDGEWFKDDVVSHMREFVRVTFGGALVDTNLRFIEESLGKDLRKYFVTDFYKDHLQTYKKRPIYWLFSSGKERAFQALVYLHRYHEGTLSRMRTEYVIPLQGKIASRIDQLADDIQKATSSSHRKKMEKEQDKLLRQRTELQAFDEKLRHYADQRIRMDLDDGVKVNYGKFGDLLAEVKAVTGGNDE